MNIQQVIQENSQTEPQGRFKLGVATEIATAVAINRHAPIVWSFDAPKEGMDIARCLHEAYEKGALEVTIKIDNLSMTYVHRKVSTMCDAWAEATRRPTLDGFDPIVDGCYPDVLGWSRSRFPMLANAFEWRNLQEQAAAQKKPEVRVVVTGVK